MAASLVSSGAVEPEVPALARLALDRIVQLGQERPVQSEPRALADHLVPLGVVEKQQALLGAQRLGRMACDLPEQRLGSARQRGRPRRPGPGRELLVARVQQASLGLGPHGQAHAQVQLAGVDGLADDVVRLRGRRAVLTAQHQQHQHFAPQRAAQLAHQRLRPGRSERRRGQDQVGIGLAELFERLQRIGHDGDGVAGRLEHVAQGLGPALVAVQDGDVTARRRCALARGACAHDFSSDGWPLGPFEPRPMLVNRLAMERNAARAIGFTM